MYEAPACSRRKRVQHDCSCPVDFSTAKPTPS
jgi:hypothetical protein